MIAFVFIVFALANSISSGQEVQKYTLPLAPNTVISITENLKTGDGSLIFDLVVNHGVNPNGYINQNGDMTLTRLTALFGNSETLEKLCQLGAKPTGKDLYLASVRGDTNVMAVLEKYGADVKYLSNFDGRSAFTRAILSGKLEAAKWLASHGSPIQTELKIAPTDADKTPFLELAVKSAHCTPEIVDYLASIGFRPTANLADKIPANHPLKETLRAAILKNSTN